MRPLEPQGWELTKGAFFGKMPAPLKWLIPPIARRGITKELHGHGMGRHSRYEFPVRENTTKIGAEITQFS